jgi:outer membrane protein assembly factor BamB
LTVILATSQLMGEAPDWPQFRGPNRDGKCQETGLLKEWPEGGPKLLWQMTGLGRGYSTLAIVEGKFYTMGDRKAEDGSESQCALAFDLASRKELWATRIGPPHSDGPRCTPTVDGELLYVVGTAGDLACLETATGKIRWTKNFVEDFGGKMMSMWKFSESPLVDGEKLVCTPGGRESTIVALDKKTGELIWKCAAPHLNDRTPEGAGYTSMVAADIDGVRQYVQIVGQGAVGVDAKTGKCLWGYGRIANRVANIPTPVVRENYVFVTTSYKTGSALLKIVKNGDAFKAEEVYFHTPREFENHHGGVVLVGDAIYGGEGQNNGAPACLDFMTGKIHWKKSPLGKRSAAVLFADGNLIFRYEDGLVALIEATPDDFRVKGTFKAPVVDGPAWPYPVIHDGKLYLRAHNTLMCYDVKAK